MERHTVGRPDGANPQPPGQVDNFWMVAQALEEFQEDRQKIVRFYYYTKVAQRL